ncbi:unnamed protein product [Closterium sp. Naga37s-1]|nr:unnamed protein product [Closterium sp. Naga37s-1]
MAAERAMGPLIDVVKEAVLAAVRGELAAHKEEVNELRHLLTAAEERNKAASVAMEERERELAEARRELAEHKGAMVEQRDVAERKREMREKLVAELAAVKGEVGEVKGEVSEVKGEVSEVKGEVGEVKGEVSEVKGEVSEVKGEVSEVKGEVGEIRHVLTVVAKRNEVIAAVMKERERELADLKGAMVEQRDVAERRDSDMREMREELVAALAAVKGEVGEVKGEVSEVKGGVSEVKVELTALKGEVSEVKGGLGEVKGEVAAHKQSTPLQLEEAERGRVAEMRAHVEERERELAAVKRELAEQKGAGISQSEAEKKMAWEGMHRLHRACIACSFFLVTVIISFLASFPSSLAFTKNLSSTLS